MNQVQNAIMERRSIRSYTPEVLTGEEIQALKDAALQAPTAVNSQKPRFSFVTSRELLDRFSEDFRECMRKKNPGWNGDVLYHAPLFVVITLPQPPHGPFDEIDAGIAAQTIVLSAQGMGLGSVILGLPKVLLDESPEWREKLGIPADRVFSVGVAIGHPAASKEAHPIAEGRILDI